MRVEDLENSGQDVLQSRKPYKLNKARCQACMSDSVIKKSKSVLLCIDCGERTQMRI